MELRELRIGQKFNISNKRHTIIDVIKDDDGNPLRVYSICGNQNHFDSAENIVLILEDAQKEKEHKFGINKINADGSVRRSMTSEQASSKKIGGHNAEYDFSDAVGGEVIGGKRKGDVLVLNESQKSYFSVKGAIDKVQVFLYGVDRFKTDEFGASAESCKACIESFPIEREDYGEDKSLYKNRLMPFMRQLKKVLLIKDNLRHFLSVAFFGRRTKYLAMRSKENSSLWYIFPSKIVVDFLPDHFKVENSKARHYKQLDNQKVIFKAEVGKIRGEWVNVGEVEMRNDSKTHYRELKFRMDRDGLLLLLQRICGNNKKEITRGEYRIILYDDAIEELKFFEINEYEKEN